MAICFSPTAIRLLLSSSVTGNTHLFASRRQSISPIPPPLKNFHGRCRVAAPGPSPPPQRDPDDDNKTSLQLTGVAATFSKFQDSARIFFAVFFWMALFFWSSIWEGWNNDKPDKGSRFRR